MGIKEMRKVVCILVAVIAVGHYLTPTEGHFLHKAHLVLTKLYLLPPLLAAIWLGFRDSIVVTVVVSLLYGIHIVYDWQGNEYVQANEISELIGIWIVALLSGYLFDHQRLLQIAVTQAHEDTLTALVSALDLREKNTALHSRRVREYALLLGRELGLDEREMRELAVGSLLHDVGKIAVADRILLKEGSLTEEEWREMRRHPEEGWRVLEGIDFLAEAADIVRSHHEKFDGTGYPCHLVGKAIPLGARIFTVVDVYDALTSARPYKAPSSHEQAVEILRSGAGLHFDPVVVSAFVKIPSSSWEDAAVAASATLKRADPPAIRGCSF